MLAHPVQSRSLTPVSGARVYVCVADNLWCLFTDVVSNLVIMCGDSIVGTWLGGSPLLRTRIPRVRMPVRRRCKRRLSAPKCDA
jgi:hypothetical protein